MPFYHWEITNCSGKPSGCAPRSCSPLFFSTAYTKCLFLTVYQIPGNPGIPRRRGFFLAGGFFSPVLSSPPSRQVAAGAGTAACSVDKAATSWGPPAQHPALPRGRGDSSPGETSGTLLGDSPRGLSAASKAGERLRFASWSFRIHSRGRRVVSAIRIAGAKTIRKRSFHRIYSF